jgi:phospholipid-binding lipoprotein MlaA
MHSISVKMELLDMKSVSASRVVCTRFFKRLLLSGIAIAFLSIVPSQSTHAQSEEIYDPLEDVNRGIFWFNDTLDVNVLEPVAKGYKEYVPSFMRTGISNFFSNLRYPSYLVSDILQGKITQAGEHTGRFLINSTVGLAGFLDIAKDVGLPDHQEDFGIMLAYHGVPAGPYLMLPLLGPSNVRDGVGLIVDGFLDPIGWIGYSSLSSSTKLIIAASALGIRTIHTRAGLIQAIETGKESSVDYYLFVQSAYYQYREGLVHDGMVPDELDEEPAGRTTKFEQPGDN